ncbi:peptidase [Mycobacterium decipiens]|uniref:Peptidase n=1 Tax=Mycobacterium decipiens TaxID=1430326 RepID=A0A1X2LV66_9MYCO|nr:peptidase [Mycobacterium decipiens]
MTRQGHRLARRGAISRLLRRWRIPRVIRHVARFALPLLSPLPWADFSTVTAQLPCARGLRFH